MHNNIFSYDVKQLSQLTPNVTQLTLYPTSDHHLKFIAGQYIKVLHTDKSESPLSIACAPNLEHKIELWLRHHERNVLALDLLHTVRTEKQLKLTGPFGNNTSKILDLEKPVIFLVRGTGFSPVNSILEEIQHRKHLPTLHVFCGIYSRKDFFFEKNLQHFKNNIASFDYTFAITPNREQEQLLQKIIEIFPDLTHVQVYASGAEEMVLSALPFLEKHGLKRKSFFSDIFDYL